MSPQPSSHQLSSFLADNDIRAWKDFGLLGWEVVHYAEGGPYQISAVLKWESPEAFAKAASGPAAQEVFSDVPNFTTAQPVLLNGAEKGSSKL